MALSTMQVFDDFLYGTMNEVLMQQTEAFNAASNNCIILRQKDNTGDFRKEAGYSLIASLMRRRDVYASGAVSPVAISQFTEAAVKIAGAAGPVAFNPSQFTWINKSPDEAGIVIGKQVAKGLFADYLNTAIKAVRAAIVNVGATTNYTVLSQGTLTLAAMNEGARLFGDSAQDIRCWVMHSSPLHDLYALALTNTATLFTFGTVQVREDGFGRRFVVTDSPSLYGAVSSPDVTDYYTLGLTENAVTVDDNGDWFANTETSNGDENIARTWQAEYTFQLGLKGYTWDMTNGGKSPTDAEIATGSNWDKTATSIKSTAGVAVRSR